MSVLDYFKSKTPSEKRCRHHYDNGSRCQLAIEADSELFCGRHIKNGHLSQTDVSQEERDSELAAIYAEVMGPVQSLDSAVAIHHVLGNLFRLTLLGRIPQRKAAQLTTQLRLALRTSEAAKHEIVTAKLFPQNNADLLNLLSLLNGDDAESENVAPHSGAAASTAPIPTSATTNSDELDLDPHDEILNPTEPTVSSTSIPPQTQSTTSTYDYSDGVCWIGPKPDQIDWARLEQDKRDYERYLRETYPVTFDGVHLVPPDKQPLWWKLKKRR